MSDDRFDRKSPEDARLDGLIRAARTDPEEGFTRPGEESISAYVLGTASMTQKEEVRAALAKSSAFRLEILQIMQDLEALTNQDPFADEERVERTELSGLRDVLKRYRQGAVGRPMRESFSMKSWRWWLTRVSIPVSVAAAAIVTIVMLTGGYDEVEIRRRETVAEEVLSFVTRGQPVPSETGAIAPQPRSAALMRLKPLLMPNGETGFKPRPTVEPETPLSGAHYVTVRLASMVGGEKSEFRLQVPREVATSHKTLTMWVLTLPSRRLYSGDFKSDRIQISWGEEMERVGCLTITYPVEGEYGATRGRTFELD